MSNLTTEQAINLYVWEQFRLDSLTAPSASYLGGFNYAQYGGIRPIFPVSDTRGGDAAWNGKTYIVYDSFITPRKRNKSLYPVKSGQMLYAIRGSLSEIITWRDFIVNVLDREDVAAREVSDYVGESGNTANFRFHTIDAIQQSYIGNTVEPSTNLTSYTANVIIRYEYHLTNIYNNS